MPAVSSSSRSHVWRVRPLRIRRNPVSKDLILGGDSKTRILTSSSNSVWNRSGPSRALVRPHRYVDTTVETANIESIETTNAGIGSGRSFRVHLVSEKYRLLSCSAGCAEQARYRDPWLNPNRDLLRQVVLAELRSRKIVPACHSIRMPHRTYGESPRSGADMANPAPNATGRK
jgi:hypothetical protein